MRCVSYTRTTSCCATEEKTENVIGIQNKQIQSFLKERGWKLEEKYSDRKNDKDADAGFQKLRADGMSRKFDMVVVGSIFRCGRSVSFAEDLLLKTFYPAGIHFAVAEDGFCSLDHTSEEVKDYMQGKRYEANVSAMRKAVRVQEKMGLLDVHDEKYGYLLKDDFSGFDVDEEVAPIIQEIFWLLGQNMTMQAVADLMNERGVECPAVHLERVGRKNFHANGRKWVLGSVQRILQNTSYIGYWTKMVGGQPETIEVPQIVDKTVFELANKNVTSRGGHRDRGIRSENAFIKQIFDKETGDVLICRRYTEDGDYQMFHRNWFAMSTGIRYESVMQETVSAIRRESEQAGEASRLMDTEIVQNEKKRRMKLLAEQGRKLFGETSYYQRKRLEIYQRYRDGECSEMKMKAALSDLEKKLTILDGQYDDLMKKVEDTKQAYSLRNPWIMLYDSIAIPSQLSKTEIRKWVDRILIEDFQKVEVLLLRQEWKAYFPPEWFEGRILKDGEKEQA